MLASKINERIQPNTSDPQNMVVLFLCVFYEERLPEMCDWMLRLKRLPSRNSESLSTHPSTYIVFWPETTYYVLLISVNVKEYASETSSHFKSTNLIQYSYCWTISNRFYHSVIPSNTVPYHDNVPFYSTGSTRNHIKIQTNSKFWT